MQGGGERDAVCNARQSEVEALAEAGAGDMLGAHVAIVGLFEVV